jgi:dTDP-glucose 4,6-dehydratase
MTENILVTGGAGFIGANFLLRMVPRHSGARFVCLDRLTYAGNAMNLRAVEDADNFHFVQGDICDPDLLDDLFDEHRFTSVVHFAAESHVDRSIEAPLAFARSNVEGTAALLEAARQAWPEEAAGTGEYRFVHISTDEVFGSLGATGHFTEETPYDPRSPYSASKAAADHFARSYFHTYGLPVVITNGSNNYGPFQFPEKLIPLVITNALEERDIPVYGTGENVRDWLYVKDHCAALEAVLEGGTPGETYLVGGDSEARNIDLVTRLCDLVDAAEDRPEGYSRDLITFVEDRPGHDYRYAIDFSKLEAELDWQPEHDLTDGLRATVDWYLRHPDWLEAVRNASYRDYYARQYG